MLELEEFQAWSVAHAEPPKSMVQSAISNIGRVAEDVNAVLSYDLEFRDNVQFARRWYRDRHGADRRTDVEQWEVHACLLQNLAIELVRAVNLLITRVRDCNQGALQGQALALIEIGPDHALMQAPAYTGNESRRPGPYPGLKAFPAAIDDRLHGTLGFHADDRPRTVEEYDSWVEKVETRVGGGSPPPPEDVAELPAALPTRPTVAGSPSGVGSVPGSLNAVNGILLVFSLAVALSGHPWTLGAALGLAIMTWRFHRGVWHWPPALMQAVATIAVAVFLGFLAQYAADRIKGSDSKGAAEEASATPRAAQSDWGPKRPVFHCDRSSFCRGSDYVMLNSMVGNPVLGNTLRFLGVKVLGDVGGVRDRLNVEPGDVVVLRLSVSNDGDPNRPHPRPLLARQVMARLELPVGAERLVQVVGWVSARNANPSAVYDSVFLESAEPIEVRLVSDSAKLSNSAHPHGLALANRLVDDGVLLGYRALNGLLDTCICHTGYVTARLDVAAG
jgi:hypothetical protein